jgi:cytochrome c-type biogenesis protein CcmF
MVLIAIGVIYSSSYSLEKEALISPGNYLSIGDYRIKYEGGESTEDKIKSIQNVRLTIYKTDKSVGTLNAQKYYYTNYEQPVTEVAIFSAIKEDIYVILADLNDDGSATLKVLINPMVSWIWFGGFVFLIGGIIAFYAPQRKSISQNI